MCADAAITDQLIAFLPKLRAFAMSLTSHRIEADDLVQETILRAWSNLDRFERGTNFEAWLFTILRNAFYTHLRKQYREVEDVDDSYASRMWVAPAQGDHLDMSDLQSALNKLSPKLREIILLVGAEGLSYEEVASICGCPIGTVKSRANRARIRLAQLLSVRDPDEIGPDQIIIAAMQPAA